LKDRIYYTIPYEEEDWAALQAHLIKHFDSKDCLHFQQELEQLVKEKWWLKDVEVNADRFNYLWHRAYGKTQDDDRKTSLYLEALPDELVWAARSEIHDGANLRPFGEVLEIASISAKQMLNIQQTRKMAHQLSAPQQEDDVKCTTDKVALQPKDKTRSPSIVTPALTDIKILTEKFEKLALQVKELKVQSTKTMTSARPCLYCDEQGHGKHQCKLLKQDLWAKLVYINQDGKLTSQNDNIYLLNIGNGSIRALVMRVSVKLIHSEPVSLVMNTMTVTIH
ncbi:hypothetical protein EV182_001934, partial [Spiromyces aspiralis]